MSIPSIIEAVEFRRSQYRLTKSEWARVIGIRPSHYSDFIRGKRGLTLAQAARCFEFGVPASALFQSRGDKHYMHIKELLKGEA